MGRRWTWTAGADEQHSVELLDDGIRWECDSYDERAGAPSHRTSLQPKDDFLRYGPTESAPENIVREIAAALGVADPRWLKPLDPRIDVLLKAASAGDVGAIRGLLATGLATDAADQRGYTALWNAILRGRNDAARMLLDAGADPKRTYRYDETALSLAAKFGDERVIKRLIAGGVDVNAVERVNGETPLFAAIEKKRPPQLIGVLIDAGSDVNRARKDGSTPLIRAVRQGLLDAVKMLIAAGAAVDSRDASGMTALLHAAKWQSDPAFCEALLAAGADIAAVDKNGMTATAHASAQHWDAVLKLLATIRKS
jgi:ankyrin repeat protein